MATVHQPAAIPVSRAAECGIAVFGLIVAGAIMYISLDLLLDGMLSRALSGAVGARAGDTGGPSPAPGAVIPRPRLATEAENGAA